MKEISFRIGNLEVRKRTTVNPYLEIVQWEEETCWTIAYWSRHKDGYYQMQFIGNRPFDERVDWKDFGQLAKTGQSFLNDLDFEYD